MAMKNFSVQMEPGMIAALTRYAEMNDSTPSVLVRHFCRVGLAELGEFVSDEDERKFRARRVFIDALIENKVAPEAGLSDLGAVDLILMSDEYIMWLIREGIKKIGEPAMKKILDEMSSAGALKDGNKHAQMTPGKVFLSDSGEPLFFV